MFYAGGHGPMFDLPGDADIAAIATQVYEKGGILSAVCHGTVGASRSVSVFVCLSAMALLVRHALSVCLSVCLPWHCCCIRSVNVFVCLPWHCWGIRSVCQALLVRHTRSFCLSVCLPATVGA